MADVESTSTTLRPSGVNNPYTSLDPAVMPTWHPLNVLWRLLYLTLALWGLHYFEAYSKLMHDPNIRHEWFKIGLAATVGESRQPAIQKLKSVLLLINPCFLGQPCYLSKPMWNSTRERYKSKRSITRIFGSRRIPP